MDSYINDRLWAIQQALMAHHAGGSSLPSAAKGSEREEFLNRYLREVLPPVYRFGQGAVTDSHGQRTGQLDVVMELPIAPSFPMPGGKDRLYLAEAVAAVIEVKSNLHKQWEQAVSTVGQVKQLRRQLNESSSLLLRTSGTRLPVDASVPAYIVGYVGHSSTLNGLKERLDSLDQQYRPDGLLVIDSGCFVGCTQEASGAAGLFAFIAELMTQVNSVLQIAYPAIQDYFPVPE